MPFFGFYSDTQSHYIHKIYYYTDLEGIQVAVTQLDNFNNTAAALDYFLNEYIKIFPDGKFVGRLFVYLGTNLTGTRLQNKPAINKIPIIGRRDNF